MNDAQSVAVEVVSVLDPESLEVVEDDWDVLEQAGFEPAPQDSEHRFVETGLTALGVAVGCAIGKIFSEAIGDIVKSEVADLWKKWRSSPLSLSNHDVVKIVAAMDKEAGTLGLSNEQRADIKTELETLFKGY